MRKNVGALLIMVLIAAAIPAADVDGDRVGSPSQTVTAGRFESDFDNYMDPAEWQTLESNVLFLEFDAPESTGSGQFQAGTGLFLGDLYFGGFIGTQLPRTDANNFDQQENSAASEIFVENGAVVAVQETTESRIFEQRDQWTEFNFLVGTSIGDMQVGFKNTIDRYQDNTMGTLGVNFGGSWGTVGNVLNSGFFGDFGFNDPFEVDGAQTNTRTTVTDASGTRTYEDIDAYSSDGFENDQSFSNWTIVGVALPDGPIDLTGYLYFGYEATNNDAEYGRTQSTTFFDENLPDYGGVSNATSVATESGTIADSYSYLTPGLYAEAAYRVSDTVVATGGLGYNISFRAGDPTSWQFRYSDYEVTGFDGTFLDTEIFEYTINAEKEVSETSQTIELPLGITVTPGDRFRYSVGYTPEITLGSSEATYSGRITSVTTASFGDPTQSDTVTTDTGVVESVTETTETQSVNHRLDLGAQFFLRDNFRINMGSTMNMNTLNKTVTTQAASDNNTRTVVEQVGDNDPVTTTSDFDVTFADPNSGRDRELVRNNVAGSTPAADYTLGFTYFFNESMELDVAYNNGLGASADSNLFNLGVWSALMTIRY